MCFAMCRSLQSLANTQSRLSRISPGEEPIIFFKFNFFFWLPFCFPLRRLQSVFCKTNAPFRSHGLAARCLAWSGLAGTVPTWWRASSCFILYQSGESRTSAGLHHRALDASSGRHFRLAIQPSNTYNPEHGQNTSGSGACHARSPFNSSDLATPSSTGPSDRPS